MSTANSQDSARGGAAPLSRQPNQWRALTSHEVWLAKRLRLDGTPFKDIAKRLGMGARQLRREWKARGLPTVNKRARAEARAALIALNRSDKARARSSAIIREIGKRPEDIARRRRMCLRWNAARRMTLYPNEVEAIVAMRKAGRIWSYITAEIGIDKEVISRELRGLGVRLPSPKRRPRPRGYWRSFDPPDTRAFPQ